MAYLPDSSDAEAGAACVARLDDLVHLAATVCDAPYAAVTYVDGEHILFEARHGLDLDSLPKPDTFCVHVMETNAPLVVPDASLDPHFKSLSIVTSGVRIRFYAGFPVVLNTAGARGVLCVLDPRSRTLSEPQTRALRTITAQVSHLLQQRSQPMVADRRRLSEILEVIPDLVAFMTPGAELLYLNSAGRRMLGVAPRESLAGLALGDFHAPEENLRLFNEVFPRVIQEGSCSEEVRYRRRCGTEFVASALLMAHKTAEGDVEYFSLIGRDVTELKLAEAELRDREAQLRQTQRLEAVGKLAGGIAHDFNNLLSAIIGFNEIAIEKLQQGEKIGDELQQIRRAANRSVTLTRQILAFARKSVLQPQDLVLRELVAESERLIERLIGEDIDVVFRPGPSSRVRVDPSQMEQVLLNLCINARDAMPDGGELSITIRDQDAMDPTFFREHPGIAEGHYVLLSVGDTGTGMEPDVAAQIFEPFFTTKDRGKGTGLGLSTVHGIVKQSGGHLWVESEVGVGSTFTLCFPAVAHDEHEHRTAQWNVAPGNRETILVAEDDELLRGLIEQVFTQANYRLLVAKDGEEAVQLCEAHQGKIDLFLTDVVMPRLSGVEAAKRLTIAYPKLKVVCMSGYADNEILERDVFDKGLPFLRKPVTPNQLLVAVRAMLDA